jgi:hypothetical protein
MTNKKTIQVNKDFLSISNRLSKKKEAKAKKTKPKSLISPNKMKKEFLKKVKNFQEKREKHLSQNNQDKTDSAPDDDINNFENEFNKSLGFLQNIMDSKNNSKPPPIQINVPKSLADSSTSTKNSTTLKLPPPPPYSCLKNSNKPTYRQWNKTLRKSNDIKNNIQIENKPNQLAQPSQRSILLENYKKENSLLNKNPKENIDNDNDNDSVFIKKKIITKTYKRKLGKIGKTISVLIKNKNTRRNIQIEKAKLALTSIPEIKEFLKKRNLIKTGSFCPNDVLRCMYEQCILTGDIDNKNSENLIHNYVNP